MTGPQLLTWRTSEDFTLREIADLLTAEGYDVTFTTIGRWEKSPDPIPKYASDVLLARTRVTLPLSDLSDLLDLSRRTGQDFRSLLAAAIHHYIQRHGPATDTTLNEPDRTDTYNQTKPQP